MDDLISRKAVRLALSEVDMPKSVIETEFYDVMSNVADRLIAVPSVPAVPLDKLSEFLADTLHTPAPCFNNEEICPRMDFGYCRLPDAPDVKECWKKILTKWMEGLNDHR